MAGSVDKADLWRSGVVGKVVMIHGNFVVVIGSGRGGRCPTVHVLDADRNTSGRG